MPDARAIVEQSVEADDIVAVEGRFTGTHTGPLTTEDGEVEPTGAVVDLRFADVLRVRDRKIVPTTPITTSSGCSPNWA
jgi:ketosteroid isomerase-like protein